MWKKPLKNSLMSQTAKLAATGSNTRIKIVKNSEFMGVNPREISFPLRAQKEYRIS